MMRGKASRSWHMPSLPPFEDNKVFRESKGETTSILGINNTQSFFKNTNNIQKALIHSINIV